MYSGITVYDRVIEHVQQPSGDPSMVYKGYASMYSKD